MADRVTPKKRTETKGFDLDSYEREDDPGPFPVTLGGSEYILVSPMEIDYRELIGLMELAQAGNLQACMEGIIPAPDRKAFFANTLPAYKLDALWTAYMKHFGLDLGEAGASPSS